MSALRCGVMVALAGCGRVAFELHDDATPVDGPTSTRDCWPLWQQGVPSFGAVEDLTPFDTSGRDHDPTLTDDGRMMFFGSARPGGSGVDDLWVATRPGPDQPFSTIEHIPSLSSTEADGPFFTRDGLRGWLSSSRFGGSGLSDLWYAERTALTDPFVLSQAPIPSLNAPDADFDAWESLDRLRLYFSRSGLVMMASRTTPAGVFGAPSAVAGVPLESYDLVLSPDERIMLYTSQRANFLRDAFIVRRSSLSEPFTGEQPLAPLADPAVYDYDLALSANGCELYWSTDRGRPADDLAIYRMPISE